MKTSNKILLTAFILIVLMIIGFMIFLRANVSFESVSGSGNVVKVERETGSFTELKFRGNLEVYLKQDSISSFVVEADDNLHDILKTEMNNGALYTYLEESVARGGTMKIHVSFPMLEKLDVSAGVIVHSEDAITGDYFMYKAQAGTKTTLNLYYDEVDMVLQAGAVANLSGSAGMFDLKSAAGVIVDARRFNVRDCKIDAKAGSVNTLNVTGNLTGSVGQGAIVYYSGSPVLQGLSTRRGGHIEAVEE